MISRRSLVSALATLALSQIAEGQAPGPVHRVGIIYLTGYHQVVVDGLRQGLHELGLDEGKNLLLDVREIHDDPKMAGDAARDLERGRAELIYTVTTQVTVAAKQATAQTPIVFYVGVDPVAEGLVESLAKPGGRLTGFHGLSRDLTVKRLEVLKEIVPKLGRVVTFYDTADAVAKENARATREAARALGIQLVERPVDSIEALRSALQRLTSRDAQAYFHTQGAIVTSQALLIVEAARVKRLPSMFHETNLATSGGLAAYGQNYREIGRMSARYVQRILTGTAPKNLPVENYDKIELAINLRTAREIGLTIPASVRLRADTVIQ